MRHTIIAGFVLLLTASTAYGQDQLNLGTGDYIMDTGGGDQLNLGTGDYIMDLGGGDQLNLDTGDW